MHVVGPASRAGPGIAGNLEIRFRARAGANDANGRPVPLGSRDLLGNSPNQEVESGQIAHGYFEHRASSGVGCDQLAWIPFGLREDMPASGTPYGFRFRTRKLRTGEAVSKLAADCIFARHHSGVSASSQSTADFILASGTASARNSFPVASAAA